MVLLFKDEAIKKAGITPTHAKAFQQVADDSLCIIMCRSVNLACTGLIQEGYASKGFKVKAKSCDWGPAAGFIAADPRFSKKGSAITAKLEQLIELHNAYTAHKDSKDALVPLYLSNERVAYLRKPNNLPNALIKVTAEDKDHIYCEASPPKDPNFLVRFMLKKEAEGWAVYYADGQTAQRYVGQGKGDLYTSYEKELKSYIEKCTSEQDKQQANELQKKLTNSAAKLKDFEQVISKGDIRVMGVANPTYIESHQIEKDLGYKRAVTGDYDLFAVIALAGDKMTTQERADIEAENLKLDKNLRYKFYDHEGIDKRPIMIGAGNNKESPKAVKEAELAAEDPYLGNITKRIDTLRKALNTEMMRAEKQDAAPKEPPKPRNMVHHSDEAGRPFDPELEYPVIAFVPSTLKNFITKLQSPQLRYAMETLQNNTVFAVENHNDFANFLAAVQTKFAVMINTSWVEPLKVAFKRGEVPMNCSVPQWEENNTLPYVRLLFDEPKTPVAAGK